VRPATPILPPLMSPQQPAWKQEARDVPPPEPQAQPQPQAQPEEKPQPQPEEKPAAGDKPEPTGENQ